MKICIAATAHTKFGKRKEILDTTSHFKHT